MQTYIQNIRTWAIGYAERFVAGGHQRHIRYAAIFFLLLFFLLTLGFHFFFSPPEKFPVGSLVRVERGMTIENAAHLLAEKQAIRSPNAFMALVRILGGYRGVIAGDYYFEVPESVLQVAIRITHGEYNLTLVRVTVPEGADTTDIADILDWKIPSFDREGFLTLAEPREGYLFPDTYFFLPNVTPEEIIRTMEENFKTKTDPLLPQIAQSGRTLSEVIIMASLVEKETIELKDKPIVAGILWKRIDIGMRLQVDAPFLYAINKNTFDLTLKDLRTDSPYNTYTRKGLPVGPIANPGLEAIVASIQPKETPYLFYLSDRSSNIHYSRNFEEHKANKRRYLY